MYRAESVNIWEAEPCRSSSKSRSTDNLNKSTTKRVLRLESWQWCWHAGNLTVIRKVGPTELHDSLIIVISYLGTNRSLGCSIFINYVVSRADVMRQNLQLKSNFNCHRGILFRWIIIIIIIWYQLRSRFWMKWNMIIRWMTSMQPKRGRHLQGKGAD